MLAAEAVGAYSTVEAQLLDETLSTTQRDALLAALGKGGA